MVKNLNNLPVNIWVLCSLWRTGATDEHLLEVYSDLTEDHLVVVKQWIKETNSLMDKSQEDPNRTDLWSLLIDRWMELYDINAEELANELGIPRTIIFRWRHKGVIPEQEMRLSTYQALLFLNK